MVKKGWDMVQRNVERVSHLVLDMLYYAKTRTPDIKQVDLGKLCKDIYELYSKKFEDLNISAAIDIQDIEPFTVDSKSLYTLILNLIENAIDACKWDKHKSNHKIHIELKENNGIIKISITDNGIGISDETKSKLFSVMYSTKGNSGSGFGLMVAKKIIDEHKGNIYIDSTLHEGSKFTVEFFRTHDDIQNLNNTIL